MKLRTTFALIAQFALLTMLSAQDNQGWRQFLYQENGNYFEICKAVEKHFAQEQAAQQENGTVEGADEGSAYNQFQRWKWFWSSRVNADGSFPDMQQTADLRNAAAARATKRRVSARGAADDCGWSLISQNVCSGGYSGMGRAISIAFHPTDSSIYYVGGESGGIWKTTDGGFTYDPISQGLPYNSASNLVVDYSNPDILYLSNGNYHGSIYSTGIYKSYDGGLSWEITGLSWSFSQNVAVYHTVMSPDNPLILHVAASNGLWRTDDGGDTWALARSGTHSDVKHKPGDGSTVYAARYSGGIGSDIYRSTDAGVNWQKLSSFQLPSNRIRMAVTPADPNYIAAVCSYGSNHKLYASTDGGATFEFRSDCPERTYVVYLSPVNPNIVYCGFLSVFRSDDLGATWDKISHWHGGTPEPTVHADQRYIAAQPGTNFIFFCNDGGVWRYDEPAEDWLELSNNLIITQFYRIAVAQTDETFMIGGTQDNGGRKRVAIGEWEATNGGDAMEVAIDYTNADIIYTTYINGQLYRSMDAWVNDRYHRISDNLPGQTPDHDLTGSWVAPYQLDPVNPQALVLGYADVYRTTNRGDTWTKISNNLTGGSNAKLDALAIAPSDPNTIYTTNNTTLYKTTNLGANWTSHSTPGSQFITSITVHPHDPSTLYITRGGYNSGNKVYRSVDGGLSWTNISGSLPNVPTNTMYLDVAADSSYTMYVGNDLGVWYRKSTMTDWVEMNQNLPISYVSDLELHRASRKLRAGTYGRGIWEYDLNHLPAEDFAICTDLNQAQICMPGSFETTISANAWQDLNGSMALSLSELPAGAVANLSTNQLAAGGTATFSIDFAASGVEGEFPVTIFAVANGDTAQATVRFTLVSNDFSGLDLDLPANGAANVSRWPKMRWKAVADANSYELELATSPAFDPASLVKGYSGLKVDTLNWNLALEEGQLYYWRVRPVNECGPGGWTVPFVFSTAAKQCVAREANDLPKPITANGTPTVESTITVLSGGPISEIKVKNFQGNHTFFKDLEAYLVSPSGTEVLLFKERCGAYNGNFMLGFEDDAPQPFGCPPPQNGNPYRPEGLLSDFKNEDAAGAWTLRVKDNVISSGGQINGFAIEFCSEVALNPPVLVQNQALQLAPGNNGLVSSDLLRTEDVDTPPEELLYTLISVPEFGELQRFWTGAMQVGDQFTQADIDNGGIRYFDYASGTTADAFRFSVTDGGGGLVADTFRIAPLPLNVNEKGKGKIAFSLAPNPATDNVVLSLSKPLKSEAQVMLHNLAGQALRQWTLAAGTPSIDLQVADLPGGVYLLLLQGEKASGVRKVVVQRR